jgi:hypothetical protein
LKSKIWKVKFGTLRKKCFVARKEKKLRWNESFVGIGLFKERW